MISSATGRYKILIVAPASYGKSSLLPTLPWYGDEDEMAELAELEAIEDVVEREQKIAEFQGKYICSFLLDPQGEQAYSHGIHRMRVIKISTGDTIKVPQIFKKPMKGAKPPEMIMGYDKYMRFAAKFNAMLASGELKKFKWICFDSLTFLSDAILMEIAEKEQRLGYKYTQEDYGRVATLLKVLIASVMDARIPLVMTAHSKDYVTKVNENDQPIMTENRIQAFGQLREHFPAMFDNIFKLNVKHYGSRTDRTLQIHGDGTDNYTRTSLFGAESEYDVSMDLSEPTRTQGLYPMFNAFAQNILAEDDVEVI